MAELTTIKVEKPVVDWLNSMKGLMEYTQSRKLTLNEAMVSILGIVDANNAVLQGTIDPNNLEEVKAYIQHKINLFWENDPQKPIFNFGTSRDWFMNQLVNKETKK